jgi:Protein of unknown function (DUF3095)
MPRPYAELPSFDAFEQVVDPSVFEAVPDDSAVCLSDIVSSTAAIAAGRYKAVNMAGAAMISAIMNALGHREFPFVFGGDGSSCVVTAAEADKARDAMASTARWVAEDLGLEMRAAVVPVSVIRAAGYDVRVARYAASSAASYAMFTGGGLAWAEQRAKAGEYALPLAPPGSRPDLTGLSCRWQPLQSRHGTMLSLIVQPGAKATAETFADVVLSVLRIVNAAEENQGHPLSFEGPKYRWPPPGLDLEARASRNEQTLSRRKRSLWLQTLLALVLFRTGWPMGQFKPRHYMRQSALNADFRKFDDGLRMTIDCRPETADKLGRVLDAAETRGTVRFGMHRQAEALMTCIVPSIVTDDHLHFVDGASGGYAMAAMQLKTKAIAGATA